MQFAAAHVPHAPQHPTQAVSHVVLLTISLPSMELALRNVSLLMLLTHRQGLVSYKIPMLNH